MTKSSKIKICKICKEEFITKGYGSGKREICYKEECRKKKNNNNATKHNNKKIKEPKPCIICKKLFFAKGNQQTCSEECSKENRRKLTRKHYDIWISKPGNKEKILLNLKKNCIICGDEFIAHGPQNICIKEECKKEKNRLYRIEWNKNHREKYLKNKNKWNRMWRHVLENQNKEREWNSKSINPKKRKEYVKEYKLKNREKECFKERIRRRKKQRARELNLIHIKSNNFDILK